MKKSKKQIHKEIVEDYDKVKSNHLEKLASKMLKEDEKFERLRKKKIKGDFLDKF